MSGKIYKINKNGTFNSKSKYIPTYHEKEKELSENKLPHKPNSSYLEILKTPLNLKSSDYDQIYLQFKALEKGLRIELDNVTSL